MVSDVDSEVFENGLDENNAAASPDVFDVMPIPYADLVVSDVEAPPIAYSGHSLELTWTVANQGIGLTNIDHWSDTVGLASDPEGTQLVKSLGYFGRIGHAAPGNSYTRTGLATLPEGLDGHLLSRDHHRRSVRIHLR